MRSFAPEAWDRFVGNVPTKHRKYLIEYYYRAMKSGSPALRKKLAYEWARYEMSILKLRDSDKNIESLLQEYSYESLAVLEAHYLRKGCFLPKNYILKNASKLANIPVSIVHGRYDLICRPVEAYALHKKLPGSRLAIVCAGHASTEPEIRKALGAELLELSKNGVKEGLEASRKLS